MQCIVESETNAYLSHSGRLIDYHNHIEKLMDEHKQEAIDAITTLLRKEHVERIARLLLDAWVHGSSEADILLKDLDLNNKHLIALDDDIKNFEKEICEEIANDC